MLAEEDRDKVEIRYSKKTSRIGEVNLSEKSRPYTILSTQIGFSPLLTAGTRIYYAR